MKKEKKPKKPFLSGYKTYDPKVEGYGNVNEWRAAWEHRMGSEAAKIALDKADPLQVLGFTSMPDKVELDKRYRELVMKTHPDRGGDAKEFIAVHAAWSLLSEKV